MERVAEVFDSVVLKHNPTVVLLVRPKKLSEPLSIQQGTFLCTGNIVKPFIDNLTAMKGRRENVKQFTLSFEHRGAALETTRKMNITRATLFPGLDGFAQSFRNFFACETPEQRERRVATEPLEVFVTEGVTLLDSTKGETDPVGD